jgi:hypothetical protein
MIHLILFVIGVMVVYRLAVLIFWIVLWLVILPLRVMTWAMIHGEKTSTAR